MSEFTSGHLLLASHKEAIRNHAVPESLIKDLDEKWVAYLTRDDHYLEDQDAPDYIYKLSNDAPVLYFTNFSDHFWGYRIFSKGQGVAYLRISYELPGEIIHKILQERYPEKEILELYEDDLQETNEQIEKLSSILNPIYVRDRKKMFDLVEEFKEIVGIDSMSWIRYERVEEQGDFEEFY